MKLRILLYCLVGGLPMLVAAMGLGSPLLVWIAGAVLAAGFVPLAVFGPRGFLRQFAVIFPVLLIVTSLCTWSEALLFKPSALGPHPYKDLVGSTVMYVLIAVVLALLPALLKTLRDDA